MISKILISFFVLCSNLIFAQNAIPDSVFQKCNTAKESAFLSDDEKSVILYVNLVRHYPDLFLEKVVKPYADSLKYKRSDKNVKSLLSDLSKAKPLKILVVDEKLYKIAKAFTQKQGKSGQTSHNIKEKYLDGENLSFGYETPLDIVMQLLIDENVPSLGHRRNILDPTYSTIAVSIGKHKRFSNICVMDFKR